MNAQTSAELLSIALQAVPEFNLASPEQTKARLERMERSYRERMERMNALSHARESIRKHGIRSPGELQGILDTVLAAISEPVIDSCFREYKDRLAELCQDLDDDLNPPTAADLRRW